MKNFNYSEKNLSFILCLSHFRVLLYWFYFFGAPQIKTGLSEDRGKIDYQINGELPKNQVIYAIQHQSIWETIVLANLLPGPISIVMKKELISIPFIGWLFKHAGAIPLDRGKQVQSIRRLLSSSKYAIDRGDNIIIYPQGTRVKPGVQKPYLPGIFALYNHLKIPVVPIALNSGKFWFNFKISWS